VFLVILNIKKTNLTFASALRKSIGTLDRSATITLKASSGKGPMTKFSIHQKFLSFILSHTLCWLTPICILVMVILLVFITMSIPSSGTLIYQLN